MSLKIKSRVLDSWEFATFTLSIRSKGNVQCNCTLHTVHKEIQSATFSYILIPISLQPNVVEFIYFKL